MKHVKTYQQNKINEYGLFMGSSADSLTYILDKINEELKPNQIIFNGKNLTYNKIKLFDGDIDVQ